MKRTGCFSNELFDRLLVDASVQIKIGQLKLSSQQCTRQSCLLIAGLGLEHLLLLAVNTVHLTDLLALRLGVPTINMLDITYLIDRSLSRAKCSRCLSSDARAVGYLRDS